MNITRFSGPATLARPKSLPAKQFNQGSPVYFGATVVLPADLKSSLKALEGQLDQARKKVLAAQEEAAKAQKRVEDELKQKNDRVKNLEKANEKLQAEIDRLNNAKQPVRVQATQLTENLRELTKLRQITIRNLEKDRNAQRDLIGRLSHKASALEKLQNRINELANQIKGDVEEIERWIKYARKGLSELSI